MCVGVKFVDIIARIFAICWGQIFQLPYIIRRHPCWLTWETISKWEIGSCKRLYVCAASQGRDERNVSWEMCPFSPFYECMCARLWGWNFGLRLSSCSSRYLGELETVGSCPAQTRGIVARGVNRKATGLRETRLRNLLLSAEQKRWFERDSSQTDSRTCTDTYGNNTCDWCAIVWIIVKAEFCVVVIAVWFGLMDVFYVSFSGKHGFYGDDLGK